MNGDLKLKDEPRDYALRLSRPSIEDTNTSTCCGSKYVHGENYYDFYELRHDPWTRL